MEKVHHLGHEPSMKSLFCQDLNTSKFSLIFGQISYMKVFSNSDKTFLVHITTFTFIQKLLSCVH